MRIARVRLTNIACFYDLTLDFRNPKTDQPCQWIVILGENGTGKSTLLHMIGATLLQSPAVYRVAGDTAWDHYVRGRFSTTPADNADVQVEIVYDAPGFDTGDGYTPVTSRAELLLTRPLPATHGSLISVRHSTKPLVASRKTDSLPAATVRCAAPRGPPKAQRLP